MRHARNLLFGPVNSCRNIGAQLLDLLGETVLLRGGLAGVGLGFRVALDASIRIEGADSAVTILEDVTALFEEGLDGVNKFLLVAVIFIFGFFGVNGLERKC